MTWKHQWSLIPFYHRPSPQLPTSLIFWDTFMHLWDYYSEWNLDLGSCLGLTKTKASHCSGKQVSPPSTSKPQRESLRVPSTEETCPFPKCHVNLYLQLCHTRKKKGIWFRRFQWYSKDEFAVPCPAAKSMSHLMVHTCARSAQPTERWGELFKIFCYESLKNLFSFLVVTWFLNCKSNKNSWWECQKI